MKVVVQRVREAQVSVDEKVVGKIGKGLVVLVGAKKGDELKDAEYLAEKIANLRIFEDKEGRMNLSALEVQAEILAVSQFTLYADASQGRRPSFTQALEPEPARLLYQKFVDLLANFGLKVETGNFGAKMLIQIANDGPVTIILES